jgi:hypothetical protein
MSKSEDRFRELMVELAGLFYTADAQQSKPSGDFGDEIETLVAFQTVTQEFIEIVEDQLDTSWREISKKKRFDPERMRVHEVFSAAFTRFKTEFAKIEDVENSLRDYSDVDDS